MANNEVSNNILGKKHICDNCGTKFYDFTKKPAICPKCGTKAKEEVVYAPIYGRQKAEKKNKSIEASELNAIKLTADMDSIGAMNDDNDDDINGLSELDDMPANGNQHAGHDDDVIEADLMEDMKNYDVILDKAEEITEEDDKE